jgi:ubiquinone/menaquinone biosynthesis C-methylase UbiE
MSLMQAYFNLVYNPVYDFTTGRLSRYSKLQRLATARLELKDDELLLCVGVGTGNEIRHILEANNNVNITGVDYSRTALEKARKKALELGKEISFNLMDASNLEFTDARFDKVFCFHVLDFVADGWDVTNEILRVLKPGGRFVITYPSDHEGPSMGYGLMKEVAHDYLNSGKNRLLAVLDTSIHLVGNMVYIPLLLRPQKWVYSRHDIETKLKTRGCKNITFDNDDVYQDLIVSGVK